MTRTLPLLLAAIVAGLAFHPDQGQAQISDPERQALIDFYHATGGDDWHDNEGWLGSAGTECDWYGVQCARMHTDNPFVVRLLLSDNNLTGQLPDSLAGLDGLITLSLSENALEGTFSPDLWGLSNLEGLSLRDNHLTGLVPPAILTMPEGAPRTSIDLSGNRLEGFGMADFPDAPQGQEMRLDVAGNLIEALPPAPWRESGAIEILVLSGNRIDQTLDFGHSPWPGLKDLDLADNTITALSGVEGDNLPDLQLLDLNGNRLEALPESLTTLETLTDLDAGNNRLAGELPEWFADLNLARLGLDNNSLSGPVSRVFEAMSLESFPVDRPHGRLGLTLHVANNRFSGPLPEIDFAAFNTPFDGQTPEFGLDLCFNDIAPPGDDEASETISSVHRAMAMAPCLGREQTEIDATIAGSWHHPGRDGEGLTQMLLENELLLTYWFTYAPPADDEPPEQMWLFGLSEPGETWSEFRPLWGTSGGRFGQGLEGASPEPGRAWMRQNRIDDDHVHFFYDYRGPGFCITGACYWEVLTERFDLTRITHMAGTTCEAQTEFQQYSGAWYNPDQAGEGFIVEVLPNDRAVVYWFTHTPDGSGQQAWMVGVGRITEYHPDIIVDPPPPNPIEAHIQIERLNQPQGGIYGPDFDSGAIEQVDWGSLEIRFRRDGDGHVVWNSNLEGYGTGDYPIERLARPMLAECDSED